MSDQSLGGHGKFAGLLLLLQGLLIILFVVFVGYSDDLLPANASEKNSKGGTVHDKYSGTFKFFVNFLFDIFRYSVTASFLSNIKSYQRKVIIYDISKLNNISFNYLIIQWSKITQTTDARRKK